jgi:chromosome segregation protein
MFEGGSAEMVLTKPPKPKAEKEDGEEEKKIEAPEESEEGVEVELKLPKKRVTSLEVLSGGERSLVGIAALFALISVSPPPFLVLDEVDAPLDERNARRFADLLKTFSKESQFVVVTHNRATMEAAHILYGVTTDSDGVSKVLSITLGEYEDEKARPA